MTKDFDGNDLIQFIEHFRFVLMIHLSALFKLFLSFRFTDHILAVFLYFGANCVADLEIIYELPEMLESFRKRVSVIDYQKFLSVKLKTKLLMHLGNGKEGSSDSSLTANPLLISHDLDADADDAAASLLSSSEPTFHAVSIDGVISFLLGASPISEEIAFINLDNERNLKALKLKEEEKAAHPEKSAVQRFSDVFPCSLDNRKVEKSSQEIYDLKIKERSSNSASVDIAFLVDCTTSMKRYIEAVRADILKTVSSIRALHSSAEIRLAFVGYRDHHDPINRLTVLGFTIDAEQFESFILANAFSKHGGDKPEDVFGGLNIIGNLDWKSQTRLLFHTGDAPCHGREFHYCLHDKYPAGDPNGLTAPVLLDRLKTNTISYFFGKLNGSTDRMIARFNEIMDSDVPFVTMEAVTSHSMMNFFIEASAKSITPSSSASASTRTDSGL
jgi:hypothetical protein